MRTLRLHREQPIHNFAADLRRAFSGIVAEFIASSAVRLDDRVSYGLIGMPSKNNFVARNLDLYRNGGQWADPVTETDTSVQGKRPASRNTGNPGIPALKMTEKTMV